MQFSCLCIRFPLYRFYQPDNNISFFQNDEKYSCSETGYRLPLKCVESQNATKEGNKSKQRKILDDASTTGGTKSTSGGPKHYITYRSCVPLVGEEKLSVLGFEVLKLQNFSLLLLQLLLDFYHEFFIYTIMLLVFPNVNALGALGTDGCGKCSCSHSPITAEQAGHGLRPKN